MILSQKNTPKDEMCGITEEDDIHTRKDDTGRPDHHTRKSSNESLYFYGDLFKCFHIFIY